MKRPRLFPMTPLRGRRLQHALTLNEVAREAGMSLSRASMIERKPGIATVEEIASLESAVDSLAEREEPGR